MPLDRPTILQIIPELDTGGAELSTVEIAGAIVEAGGRAIVLSEGGRLAARVDAVGGEHVTFPAATKNPAQMLWNARSIASKIRSGGVNLVHARSRAPAWSAFLAARWCGVPFITTYHGAYNEKGPIKRAYNSVMARGELVIANSKYTSALVQSRYGTPSSRMRVIYRGVDGATFNPANIAPERKQALMRAWGLPGGTRIVLQAARLTAWKGQSVVIAAVKRLFDEGRFENAALVLAGDAQGRNAYRDRLIAEINEAGLAGRVHLVGHVDDIPAALALAHLSIVASIEPEAFGRTATEAQVMGCPVIATNIGAPPETVLSAPVVSLDQRTGWLIPPSNPELLAEAMGEALALSPSNRAALGQRARQHVLSSFSLSAMRQQTMGVYDEILGTALAAKLR